MSRRTPCQKGEMDGAILTHIDLYYPFDVPISYREYLSHLTSQAESVNVDPGRPASVQLDLFYALVQQAKSAEKRKAYDDSVVRYMRALHICNGAYLLHMKDNDIKAVDIGRNKCSHVTDIVRPNTVLELKKMVLEVISAVEKIKGPSISDNISTLSDVTVVQWEKSTISTDDLNHFDTSIINNRYSAYPLYKTYLTALAFSQNCERERKKTVQNQLTECELDEDEWERERLSSHHHDNFRKETLLSNSGNSTKKMKLLEPLVAGGESSQLYYHNDKHKNMALLNLLDNNNGNLGDAASQTTITTSGVGLGVSSSPSVTELYEPHRRHLLHPSTLSPTTHPVTKVQLHNTHSNHYPIPEFHSKLTSSQYTPYWSTNGVFHAFQQPCRHNTLQEWSFTVSMTKSPINARLYRKGLRNLGNTCYMNSVIQCLASVPQIPGYFKVDTYKDHIPDISSSNVGTMTPFTERSGPGDVAEKFAIVINSLTNRGQPCTSNSSSQSNVNIMSLKMALGARNECFNGYQQQDASEFFLCLINAIHDDVNLIGEKQHAETEEQKRGIEKSRCLGQDDQSDNIMATRALLQYLSLNNRESIILKTFMFQTRGATQCRRCGFVSKNFGTEFAMELPFPDSVTHNTKENRVCVALEDCLATYCQVSQYHFENKTTEALALENKKKDDSGYFCEKCNCRVNAQRQITLYSIPNILVLTLKRFKNHGDFSDKISNPVSFPEILDMRPYCCSSLNNTHDVTEGPSVISSASMLLGQQMSAFSTKYRLCGVVNHRGNCNGGHYTSDVCITAKSGGSQNNDFFWSNCSDEAIDVGDKPNRSLCYMLFYRLAL